MAERSALNITRYAQQKKSAIESEAAQISDSNISYFGIWEITSGAPSGFSALSEADIMALIGKRFEYFKEYALYGDAQKLILAAPFISKTKIH